MLINFFYGREPCHVSQVSGAFWYPKEKSRKIRNLSSLCLMNFVHFVHFSRARFRAGDEIKGGNYKDLEMEKEDLLICLHVYIMRFFKLTWLVHLHFLDFSEARWLRLMFKMWAKLNSFREKSGNRLKSHLTALYMGEIINDSALMKSIMKISFRRLQNELRRGVLSVTARNRDDVKFSFFFSSARLLSAKEKWIEFHARLEFFSW